MDALLIFLGWWVAAMVWNAYQLHLKLSAKPGGWHRRWHRTNHGRAGCVTLGELQQGKEPKMKRTKPLRKGPRRIEISKSKVLRLTDLRKPVKKSS